MPEVSSFPLEAPNVTLQVVNSKVSGKVEPVTFMGRSYLKVPVTMIVPGVLPGSKGKLYYPPDELAANVGDWNGVPLVGYHPRADGVPISARDPLVLEAQGLGFVFNSEYKDRLQAVAYFDVERTERFDRGLDPEHRILPRLRKGEPIEVSTGVFTEDEPVQNANYNGVAYDFVARKYRPDHLAVLPDQVGACSIKDGCGLLINSKGEVVANAPYQPPEAGDAPDEVKAILKAVYTQYREKHPGEDPEVKARGAKMAWGAVRRAGWKKNAEGKWVKRKKAATMAGNDNNQDEGPMNRDQLISWLTTNCECWKGKTPEELAANKEALAKLPTNNLATMKAGAEKTALALNQASTLPEAPEGGLKDGVAYTVKDGKFVEVKAEEKKVEAPTTNSLADALKSLTPAQVFSLLPPEAQLAVNEGKKALEAERGRLIESLLSRKPEGERKALLPVLNAKSLEDLRLMASFAPTANDSDRVVNPFVPQPIYFGGAPTANAGRHQADEIEDVLDLDSERASYETTQK